MKHKLLTLFLVLAASIGITNAAIVNGTCGENLTWSLNTKDSTLTIEGSGKMSGGDPDAWLGGSPWSNYSSYIASVSIPVGLTYIDNLAFVDCDNLSKVYISDLAAWCNINFKNNPLSYAHRLFLNGVEIIDLVIPNGVTSIGERAFIGGNFTSVTIPNSVIYIGYGAFGYCSGLTSVTIGNSVTSIGDYAFDHCSGLTSVTIGNSVTRIGHYAFNGCSSLTSVTIGNSVTSIGYQAFKDCTGLTSVTIPNSVTYIGGYAFSGCSGLNSITIPSSVTSIESGAFSGCNLAQITCEAVTPPEIDENTFDDKTIPLFVPEESIETYSNTLWWEEFSNIYAIGTIIGTYTVEFRDWDGTVLKTETVNHGSAAEAPEDPYREGYTFIGWDVDFNSVKEDLIVTAQYELGENKTFQISFNDKDNNIIIQNEVVLKVPAAPEIEGFTFLGWRPVANIIEYNYIEIEAVYQADGQSAAPEVFTNPANKAQKLIREGNVYILHDNGTYTATGMKVE